MRWRVRWRIAAFRAMIQPMPVECRLASIGILAFAFVFGCTADAGPTPVGSPAPTTPVLPTVTPQLELPRDTGWQQALPGVEVRQLRPDVPGGEPTFGQRAGSLTLVRLQPDQVRFRVLYAPGRPRRVADWANQAGALLVVNAGFFTKEGWATALVVSDGTRREQTYRGFGGMFAVSGKHVWIQSLAEQPYDPTQPLEQAAESFPMLVKPGGVSSVTEASGAVAPRTAIAMDRRGRVIILVCPSLTFTLGDLASFMMTRDLDVDVALNLDGGTSTGLWLRAGGVAIEQDSVVPVPAVIAVQAR